MSVLTHTKQKLIITPQTKDTSDPDGGFRTIVFNCYCHTFDEVVKQIMRAIRCSNEQATDTTSIAENTGSATVCTGSQEYCENVANILSKVGLTVTVIQ